MAKSLPLQAPLLSTSDQKIVDDARTSTNVAGISTLSTDDIFKVYEIERTIREVREAGWRRVALQFPDEMLVDAARVVECLRAGLQERDERDRSQNTETFGTDGQDPNRRHDALLSDPGRRLYVLGDTSYGACCVDEIAAEHVDADVVVHYGRACLSPTARLPVIHVFTQRSLPLEVTKEVFMKTYPERTEKVILMADVMFSNVLPLLLPALQAEGYQNVHVTSVVHDPASPLPNRTVPSDVGSDPALLSQYHLFHVADPPASLLLTLASRVASMHILPSASAHEAEAPSSVQPRTMISLRRRYASVLALATVQIFGILINTLSVKHFLHVLEHVKRQIAVAGKKSYTFVMGKVNAAKLANFAEVGGWVVIGCWESSLIESKDFWKPVITPFELELALQRDDERIWTGRWSSNFDELLQRERNCERHVTPALASDHPADDGLSADDGSSVSLDSEPESIPPEFDWRLGRYVPSSRLTSHRTLASPGVAQGQSGKALIPRTTGELATVGGQISAGAEFLRSKRTWRGLGSDVEIGYDDDGAVQTQAGAPVEEGRSGIARGYRNGVVAEKR
ncbi:MAG: Diphthamide biosynthesis protein 2 [Phylliscum demangeonii]|nr:MAG: Diphthamide biosynthesis protein 2 [Phylliscum demangeonii]